MKRTRPAQLLRSLPAIFAGCLSAVLSPHHWAVPAMLRVMRINSCVRAHHVRRCTVAHVFVVPPGLPWVRGGGGAKIGVASGHGLKAPPSMLQFRIGTA